MGRPAVAALVVAVVLAAAGCGGDGSDKATPTETDGSATATAPEWAAPLLREPGPEGAAVMASSDFAVGPNRVSFLLVRSDSSLVRAPLADVYYRPTGGGATVKAVARLTPFGATASTEETEDVTEVYVAELELPRPGKQWIVIQPRGVAFQGFQMLDIQSKPKAVGIGDRAPASSNPTTATKPANRITTASPPDTALLRYSVAESLEDRVPFVVAFATPAYCQTRTCGPTVDVVDAVRKRYESKGIRFIHIEIYEDNLPGNGDPLGTPVEAADRALGVRRRPRGHCPRPLRGRLSVTELEKSIRQNLL